MLIIVEGSDRVGKSTFCEKLSKALKFPVMQITSFKKIIKEILPSPMYTVRDHEIWSDSADFTFAEMYKNLKFDVILDRFYPSNFAYVAVKKERHFDLRLLKKIEDLLIEEDVLIFYLQEDVEVIKSRFASEDYLKVNEIEPLIEEYEKFLKWTRIRYACIKNVDGKYKMLRSSLISDGCRERIYITLEKINE
jgi:thymidylate kinase